MTEKEEEGRGQSLVRGILPYYEIQNWEATPCLRVVRKEVFLPSSPPLHPMQKSPSHPLSPRSLRRSMLLSPHQARQF